MYVCSKDVDQLCVTKKQRLPCGVMHQSFVTTATPTTGKGGDYDFSAFSALL